MSDIKKVVIILLVISLFLLPFIFGFIHMYYFDKEAVYCKERNMSNLVEGYCGAKVCNEAGRCMMNSRYFRIPLRGER